MKRKIAYAYSDKIVCYIDGQKVSTVFPRCESKYNLALARTRVRGYLVIDMQ